MSDKVKSSIPGFASAAVLIVNTILLATSGDNTIATWLVEVFALLGTWLGIAWIAPQLPSQRTGDWSASLPGFFAAGVFIVNGIEMMVTGQSTVTGYVIQALSMVSGWFGISFFPPKLPSQSSTL